MFTCHVAFVSRAIFPHPALLTVAHTLRGTQAMTTAVVLAFSSVTLSAGPQSDTLALSCSIVARSMRPTLHWAVCKLACGAFEGLEALAFTIGALPALVTVHRAPFV